MYQPHFISHHEGLEGHKRASNVCVILSGLMNTWRSISSPCVGGLFLGSFLETLSVIARDFNLRCGPPPNGCYYHGTH